MPAPRPMIRLFPLAVASSARSSWSSINFEAQETLFANSSYQDCLTMHRVLTAFTASLDTLSEGAARSSGGAGAGASTSGVVVPKTTSTRRPPPRTCRLEHPDDYEVGF